MQITKINSVTLNRKNQYTNPQNSNRKTVASNNQPHFKSLTVASIIGFILSAKASFEDLRPYKIELPKTPGKEKVFAVSTKDLEKLRKDNSIIRKISLNNDPPTKLKREVERWSNGQISSETITYPNGKKMYRCFYKEEGSKRVKLHRECISYPDGSEKSFSYDENGNIFERCIIKVNSDGSKLRIEYIGDKKIFETEYFPGGEKERRVTCFWNNDNANDVKKYEYIYTNELTQPYISSLWDYKGNLRSKSYWDEKSKKFVTICWDEEGNEIK